MDMLTGWKPVLRVTAEYEYDYEYEYEYGLGGFMLTLE